MSSDGSTVAARRRDPPPSESPTAPDARSVRAPTVLTWTQPPGLARDGCVAVNARLTDTGLRYDELERRAHAVWLRHLLSLGCIKIESVCEALASPHPYLALQALEIQGVTTLCQQLESIVAQHALGCGTSWYPCVLIDLLSVRESHEPTLLFRIDEPYHFCVDSLHRVPARLARLVYESFHLISYTLLPCMLPHELRRDQARFQVEEYAAEFELIRRHGGLRDIRRAARFVASKKDWNRMSEFSSDPQELREQLQYFTDVQYLQPAWMVEQKMDRPIRHARRLLKRVAQYEIDAAPHPWSDYARHVCETILARHPDEAALKACCKRVQRHMEQEFDNGVSMYFSLILSSDGPIEREHLKAVADGLMEGGECSIERYSLARMASKHLREILELRALALGLLARAQAINDIVLRHRCRRSAT